MLWYMYSVDAGALEGVAVVHNVSLGLLEVEVQAAGNEGRI